MSTGESESSQDQAPRKLGLERLSIGAMDLLGSFISREVSRLAEAYEIELRETLLAHDPEQGKARIEEAARSSEPEERRTACQVIPFYTVADPERGFALWRQLIEDSDETVHEDARAALIRTLGILELDPEGVVSLIEADYEWEGGQ
jgi:hypothetical protein